MEEGKEDILLFYRQNEAVQKIEIVPPYFIHDP
jgi:hypothetical protein